MRKVAYRANGVPFKILSRILWHPAFQSGYPVRFRVATNVTKPTVRFNWHWLDIRLPPEYGRHIRLLSRLVKQLRNGYNGRRKPNRANRKAKVLTKEVLSMELVILPEIQQRLLPLRPDGTCRVGAVSA